MTGLVRKAMFMGVCGLLAAATAFANVPNPGNSTYPTFIPVVGTQQDSPHGTLPGSVPQQVTFTIRDFTSNPIAGANVLLDFSACVGPGSENDIKLCSVFTAATNATSACGAAGTVGDQVFAQTDGAGQVTLTVIGAARNTGNSPGAAQNCVQILVDGVDFGFATAYVLDQDGNNTHNGVDLSFSAVDVNTYTLSGGLTYRGRSAVNKNPAFVLNGLDNAAHGILLGDSQLARGSATGCYSGSPQSYCP